MKLFRKWHFTGHYSKCAFFSGGSGWSSHSIALPRFESRFTGSVRETFGCVLLLEGEWSGNLRETFGSVRSLPTSQPNEDGRLARRQRIVPREEYCMQKNSRSAAESVSVSVRESVRCKNVVPGCSQLQWRNYSSQCSFSQSGGALHLDLFGWFMFGLCLMWKCHCGRRVK